MNQKRDKGVGYQLVPYADRAASSLLSGVARQEGMCPSMHRNAGNHAILGRGTSMRVIRLKENL